MRAPSLLCQATLLYAAAGIAVFPVHSTDAAGRCSCGSPSCTSPGKHPRTAHGLNDATTDAKQIAAWWGRWPEANIAMNCGASGRVVVDIDERENRHGFATWEALEQTLGLRMAEPVQVATPSGGRHCHYLSGERKIASGNDALGEGVDIKAEGGYVLLPPSSIAGVQYTWLEGRGVEQASPLPAALGERLTQARTQKEEDSALSGDDDVSAIPAGRRNEALASLAGTMRHRGMTAGAIEAALQTENRARCHPPLDELEVRSIACSIGSYPPACGEGDDLASDENGWVVGDGTRLLSPVKNGLQPWANFDARVVGVTVDREGHHSYLTDLARSDGASHRLLLEASALGNLQRLNVTLAAYGCSILPPARELHRGHEAARLLRYLEAQQAATYKVVEALGWHEGVGFLTHEGVITAQGFSEHLEVAPHPLLANRAPYRYGFGDKEQAVALLGKLLTLHDETVCSVVGAWLVACVLHEHLRRYARHFPDLGLEGASGTGKTTGCFADLVQLICGNAEGPCDLTAASLRDRLSAHCCAPVWLDDVAENDAVYDLLRQATAGASRAKMDQDNTHIVSTRLLSPVLLSAEYLGPFHSEKAMMDRALVVEVPSPLGLRSLRHPHSSRYDELMDLRAAYRGDFTGLAGTVVQLVLGQACLVGQFREQRDGRSGREADKMAVLRIGALVLSTITAEPAHMRRVEAWIASQGRGQGENLLTFEMIPRALRAHRLPASATPAPPAFYERRTGTVWFSEPLLCDWWAEQRNLRPRERELGSPQSVRQQRKALGIEGRGASKTTCDERGRGGSRLTARYHALSVELSAHVLERSGLADEDGDEP